MAKIYQFPQGEERGKLRKEIIRERKKRLREKNGNPVTRLSGTLNGSGFIYVLQRLAHCI